MQPEPISYARALWLLYPRGAGLQQVPPEAKGMPWRVYCDWCLFGRERVALTTREAFEQRYPVVRKKGAA